MPKYQSYYLTAFILFFLLYTRSYGQNYIQHINIDSTFNELKVKPNTIEKVEQLITLYKASIQQRTAQQNIIDEALDVSNKIFYVDGIAKCYNRKGIAARYNNDYRQSVIYHKRALAYFDKTTDTLSKIKCLNSLGVSYRKLNIEKDAFKYYFLALQLSEKIDNKRSTAIALNGIGNVFITTEEFDKALYYFNKALKIETINNNPKGQEYGLANIGEIFLNKKSYDSAYYYFDKALILAKKHPRREGVAIKYTLLGLLNQKKGNYKTSIDYYKKAIPQLTEYNNLRYLGNTLINIGINQLHLKQYNNAFENINDGLANAKTIKSKENIMLGYNALTEYYTITKDYKNALKASKKASVFHDSIVNESSQKNIISIQVAYETEKKDAQIQKLAHEKEFNLKRAKSNYWKLIFGGLLSVAIIVGLLFLFNLFRKNKALELDKKNSEIQKYVLQINTLKNKIEDKNPFLNKVLTEKFNMLGISKREIEVLHLIVDGHSNDEIAQQLFVSKNTVKTHIKHIYSKLDVKNRIEAIRKVNSV